jgi:hypothetical protein
MAGLTSKVQIVSNALLLLGDRPISSLTEETTGATLGSNLFENTYLSLLQNHRWGFAKTTALLSRYSSTPMSGYAYAFALPSDFLYIIKGSDSNYAVYEDGIHANSETFTIDYIKRVDEDKLPAYFAKALEVNLAYQFAVPLTGDIAKGQYYESQFNNYIRKAKFSDSTQYPEVSVQSQPYVDVRY